jgi:hypothetical protein
MSASATPVHDFVLDMDLRRVGPFKQAFWDNSRIQGIASRMRDAASAEDAAPVAYYLRKTRWERLWNIKKCLTFRHESHPRIDQWVHEQLGMRQC